MKNKKSPPVRVTAICRFRGNNPRYAKIKANGIIPINVEMALSCQETCLLNIPSMYDSMSPGIVMRKKIRDSSLYFFDSMSSIN